MEEWNEYGELKENVGTGGAAPPSSTPSAPSTPSKAPKPADTPSKVSLSTATPSRPQQSSTTDSPLTTAMRQAGFEAAKKAGDAKSHARVKIAGESRASVGALQMLDNSIAADLQPPAGTTEASSAKASETGSSSAESKADAVPATSRTHGKDTLQLRTSKASGSESSAHPNEDAGSPKDEDEKEHPPPPKPATGQSNSRSETSSKEDESSDITDAEKVPSQQAADPGAGQGDIVKILKEQGKTGGPVVDSRKLNSGKTAAEAARTTEEAHRALPSLAKKTQDQAAANGEQVGESVDD